jgi:hypothetical protein
MNCCHIRAGHRLWRRDAVLSDLGGRHRMGAAAAIRADMEAAELRRLARRERDGRVSARLIARRG